MKLFKFVVMMMLIFITLRTGYLALLYKVEIATSLFLICAGLTYKFKYRGTAVVR